MDFSEFECTYIFSSHKSTRKIIKIFQSFGYQIEFLAFLVITLYDITLLVLCKLCYAPLSRVDKWRNINAFYYYHHFFFSPSSSISSMNFETPEPFPGTNVAICLL